MNHGEVRMRNLCFRHPKKKGPPVLHEDAIPQALYVKLG